MTSQPGPIRVAIIEDQREVREGLGLLIGNTPGYQNRGAYGSVEAAMAPMKLACPDVVLIDIGLPGMSGMEGIGVLKSLCVQAQFLVLTVYDDDRRIFEAMCAGACGYLLKKTPPPRILEALREVHTGGAPMSPEVARRVIGLFRQVRPPEMAEYLLTAQETRVLRLLGEGHHYKTAAADLGISVNTLSFHVRRIYDKLQVHSKSEAVAKALRDGILR
jgi:DNA-binding NarL/FixJ family response regulator